MSMSYLQSQQPECTMESFFKNAKQKKVDCSNVDRFFYHCSTVFEVMGCNNRFPFFQGAQASLSDLKKKRVLRKEKNEELRRGYLGNKGYNTVDDWALELVGKCGKI